MNKSSDIPVSSTRLAMNVGAVTAALMLLVSFVPVLNQFGLIGIFVFACGICYGIRMFRKMSGVGSYGKLLATGIRTAFYASLILAFVMYVTVKAINPGIVDEYLKICEQVLQPSMPPEMLSNYMEQCRKTFSPVFLAFGTLMLYTLTGTVAAAICAVWLRKSSFLSNHTPE
ncbi:MAG: DUF4199 domain-containing protein [Bacteroidales bacterium]|jgi:hypothetical protein|nr:DUF4199 domain-containing protein [Bacteroidales bacterium]